MTNYFAILGVHTRDKITRHDGVLVIPHDGIDDILTVLHGLENLWQINQGLINNRRCRLQHTVPQANSPSLVVRVGLQQDETVITAVLLLELTDAVLLLFRKLVDGVDVADDEATLLWRPLVVHVTIRWVFRPVGVWCTPVAIVLAARVEQIPTGASLPAPGAHWRRWGSIHADSPCA